MKFGKQLESEAEDIPSEWRPYLIQYKALKKLIAKVATEIEKRGLSAALLRQALQSDEVDLDPNAPRIQYYFTREPPNVRPCIRFTYNRNHKEINGLLSKLVVEDDKVEDESELSAAKLSYSRTEDQVDFFTLSRRNSTVKHHGAFESEDADLTEENMKRRRSATAAFLKQLAQLSLQDNEDHENRITELDDDAEQGMTVIVEEEDGGKVDPDSPEPTELRSIVIELEQDDEFFQTLMTELSQATALQDKTKQRFEQDVNELERRMVKVAAPSHVSEMYTWREIFSVYMDAQIFRGRIESDRTIRSVSKSKAQLQWFTQQLEKKNLLARFKTKSSKQAFEQFIALNTELITMKHYQLLNQTAVTKILKKHDKRSGLTASSTFPSIVRNEYIFSPKLADILCAAVLAKVTTVIPQPDDYLCPVCMSIAWRPIRLVCGHVFCVRCLIKAQKKHMDDCPLCRHPTAVQQACALNLDVPMQNFMKMYFPKEIKQKKKENEREQALEDVQAIMGRAYTEEQLLRMNRRQQQDGQCTIM